MVGSPGFPGLRLRLAWVWERQRARLGKHVGSTVTGCLRLPQVSRLGRLQAHELDADARMGGRLEASGSGFSGGYGRTSAGAAATAECAPHAFPAPQAEAAEAAPQAEGESRGVKQAARAAAAADLRAEREARRMLA